MHALVWLAAAAVSTTPATQIQFYTGESQVFLPDGRLVATSPVLIERVVDPGRSLVLERVISPDREHPGAYSEYVITMAIAPATQTLTMTERSNAFSGEGSLTGPLWAWTGWQTTSRLPGGVRVESRDVLTATSLVAEKDVYGPNGALQVRLKERYKPIDAATFAAVYYERRLGAR